MNEYLNIHRFIREDSWLKGIDRLFSLLDIEYYAGNPEKRIPINVAFFNYHYLMFSPNEKISRMVLGLNFRDALQKGLFKLVEEKPDELIEDRHSLIKLPRDKPAREKLGLDSSGALQDILLFSNPQTFIPFKRDSGTYEGERFIGDPLFRERYLHY